jgi:hypothetical protein
MNKANLGLHAWGNVVPCCKDCNNAKQQTPWYEFLIKKAECDAHNRKAKIENFVASKNYDPA